MLFFRFCGCFSCSREVLRTRRSLKLASNSFENDLQSESYFRKINVKKISKNLYEIANSCVEFRKNSRFSSIFFKIHNFGTHIFLYVYTTHTQLPHMSFSGFQIHNTCYTHVKSCVYMCYVQGSTLKKLTFLAILDFYFQKLKIFEVFTIPILGHPKLKSMKKHHKSCFYDV